MRGYKLTDQQSMDMLMDEIDKALILSNNFILTVLETVTLASKVKDIFRELVKKQKFVFSKLCTSKKYTKLETVTAFSGILELSKRNKIITNQEENFGDILVGKK